ncbi:sulfatase-like hydrolase/transferase [Halopelagius longus]|uniref:Arylsulfatase n=1 Tax=Halopelagius longus TaxID=1236180 RepID=A0A1H1GFV4_9EURY|nr:sulfatase-like hydrolase/transferase [Halopelagius longus]RDI69616.1 arylsulfatase [Halopelagius longus]SDR12057.1 Arylsulfatase A [Halopelagius longus]
MDVVLITAAAARHDYVFDGDGRVTDSLPALSTLASESAVFSCAYSGAPSSKTTMHVLLTGSHATGQNAAELPTILERFEDAGYATAAFHGNPDDDELTSRGFTVPNGESRESGVSDRFRRAVGRRISDDSTLSGALEATNRTLGSSFGVNIASSSFVPGEVLTDRALEWMDETDGPRFLWVHYGDALPPHQPRPETESESLTSRRATRLAHACRRDSADISEEDEADLKQLYRGELQHLDRCIGTLLEGLDARLDRTESTVAFAGTNGCALGDGDGWHEQGRSLADECVRVPVFVDGPTCTSGRYDFAVSAVDVLPTLIGAANREPPEVGAGSDLGSLTDRRVTERQVFARTTGDPPEVMVCNGRWKLVRRQSDGRERLYDRSQDADGMRDRSGENLPVHRALRHALDCFVESRGLRDRSRFGGRSSTEAVRKPGR